MAVAPALGVAQAGLGILGGLRQQEQANAAQYANYLQQEYQRGVAADQQNLQINEAMANAIRRNRAIEDRSLTQSILSSQALSRQIGEQERSLNVAARREIARGEASASSRGVSSSSASAQAIRRAALNTRMRELASADSAMDAGLESIRQQRESALGQRDFNLYIPTNFRPSAAPKPQDNSFGIIAGGILGGAAALAQYGVFSKGS